MKRPNALLTYVLVVAATVGADLWSKSSVFELLEVGVIEVEGTPHLFSTGSTPELRERPIVADWFSLQAVLNYGAFNGWFSGVPWLLIAISFAAALGTGVMVAFPARSSPLLTVALALIAGGALGNLYDRVQIGAVRDFIKWFYVDANGVQHVWPNFNIADSAICVGVGLILVGELNAMRKPRGPEEDEAKPPHEPKPPTAG